MNVLYVDINIARFSKVVELDKSTWTLGKFIPSAVPKKITGIRSKNKFGMKGTKSKELPYKMKAILIKFLSEIRFLILPTCHDMIEAVIDSTDMNIPINNVEI